MGANTALGPRNPVESRSDPQRGGSVSSSTPEAAADAAVETAPVGAVDFPPVTELAALASARWLGRGANPAPHQAAGGRPKGGPAPALFLPPPPPPWGPPPRPPGPVPASGAPAAGARPLPPRAHDARAARLAAGSPPLGVPHLKPATGAAGVRRAQTPLGRMSPPAGGIGTATARCGGGDTVAWVHHARWRGNGGCGRPGGRAATTCWAGP